MATIVQPYNPWREQLALTALGNVAGNIISDLWKNHNQNEQNRKVNAFRGQLNQDLNNNAQNNAVSLTAMGAPDGYNSNPWANAFHKTDSPLTQFDIGTAGIGRTPSIQDIMRGVDSLAATSRFSMINPETIGKIRNDLLQGAYAEMFRNAGNDIQGQMNALTMGAANGVVAPQILTAFSPYAAHMTPHHESKIIDADDGQVVMDYNPANGNFTQKYIIPKGINPTNLAVANASANAHISAANIAANAQRDVANITANARANSNGNQHMWNSQNDAQNKYLEAKKQEINNEIATWESRRDEARIHEEKQAINNKIAELIQLRDAYDTAQQGLLWSGYGNSQGTASNQGQRQPTADNNTSYVGLGDNTAFNMLGVKSAPITSNFNVPRPNNKRHKGMDIAMPKGTPIRLDDFGIPLTVKSVGNEPGGYGNYVVAQGKFIGQDGKEHKIELRWAHLDNGSINLSVNQTINYGDLIGKVGNTGRVRSSTGGDGSHLHLETSIDGVLVNPQSFRQKIAPYIADAKERSNPSIGNMPDNQNGNAQPTRNPAQTTDSAVMSKPNGQVITQSQLDSLIEEVGKEGYGPAEAKRRLRMQGYSDIPEKTQNPKVAPALNWSPSYMGRGIPQGQALTSAPNYSFPTQNNNPIQDIANNIALTVLGLGNNSNQPLDRNSTLFNTPFLQVLQDWFNR